jgi:hypothetical protein
MRLYRTSTTRRLLVRGFLYREDQIWVASTLDIHPEAILMLQEPPLSQAWSRQVTTLFETRHRGSKRTVRQGQLNPQSELTEAVTRLATPKTSRINRVIRLQATQSQSGARGSALASSRCPCKFRRCYYAGISLASSFVSKARVVIMCAQSPSHLTWIEHGRTRRKTTI